MSNLSGKVSNMIRELRNKMLDIISMITFLFIFIGLPMILIIIGGNDKTE